MGGEHHVHLPRGLQEHLQILFSNTKAAAFKLTPGVVAQHFIRFIAVHRKYIKINLIVNSLMRFNEQGWQQCQDC